ncbi:MAG: hypothetical protein IT368_05930, partial [Candidatus Hydrogenedentes bacterium]|nr:hypothetical protein [Candidatus Hydrogenedentota bacterium]
MNRRHVVIFGLLGLMAFAIPAEEWTTTATLARDRVLVNGNIVSIGPYAFLVDSCISHGILHEGVDLYLSLPRAGTASDGTPIVVADPFEFGPMAGASQEFLVKDLTALSEITGADIGGIVPLHQPGLEVTLDFPGKKVIWRSLDQAELIDESAPGSVPLRFDAEGAPQLPVLVAGKRLVNARIDTAFGGVLALPESTCRDAGVALDRPLVTLLPEGRERRQVLIESASA